MDIQKIKWDGQKTTVKWEEQHGDGTTTIAHELTSSDRPSPEFVDAMSEVVGPVMKLLELPADYKEGVAFRGATVSFDDQGRRGMTVCVLKTIKGASAPVVLNTPYLPEQDPEDPNPCLPLPLEAAVDRVLAFAERFVRGNEREQGVLDFAAPSEGDLEDEVADTLEDRGLLLVD